MLGVVIATAGAWLVPPAARADFGAESALQGLVGPPQLATAPLTLVDERLETLPLAEARQAVDFFVPWGPEVRATAFSSGDAIGGRATARFHDLVEIVPSDPSLLGTPGTLLVAGMVVYGGLVQGLLDPAASAAGAGDARYRVTVAMGGTVSRQLEGALAGVPGPGGVGLESVASGTPLHQYHDLSHAFVFGSPFEVSLEVEVEASAELLGPGDPGALHVASASLLVLGPLFRDSYSTEIRDASGERVLDYTITSESGWEPMYGPEPGFGVLLASGVLALSLVVASSPRRRSRSRSPTRG